MPPRVSEIPHHRERASLQSIKDRNWVAQIELYPAGNGTIASMTKKGWIETRVDAAGLVQFRITAAGKAAVVAEIPSDPRARRSKLPSPRDAL
jgi:hypothetical protein